MKCFACGNDMTAENDRISVRYGLIIISYKCDKCQSFATIKMSVNEFMEKEQYDCSAGKDKKNNEK